MRKFAKKMLIYDKENKELAVSMYKDVLRFEVVFQREARTKASSVIAENNTVVLILSDVDADIDHSGTPPCMIFDNCAPPRSTLVTLHK